MLRTALIFIENHLSQYMAGKDPLVYPDLGSVVALAGLMDRQGNPVNESAHIHITLAGLEEEKFEGRRPYPIQVESNGQKKYVELPAPYLINAYLLFSAVDPSYPTALRDLSLVLAFFQENPVFDDTVALNAGAGAGKDWQFIEKLVFNLHTLTLEQQNNLWAALGAKYLPHAVFKMRMLTVFGKLGKDAMPIAEIAVSEQTI